MLTANRTPCDHLLSAGLNNFYSSLDIKSSLKAGAISYFAIKASNEIAKKNYANAALSGICGVLINQFLGENTMNNPYLNNNNFNNNFPFHNHLNCPYNPYLNNNNNFLQPQNRGFFANQGNGMFGSPMVKGILIGAALAYLLSNKDAKDSLAKGVAKIQSFASAAIEEFKEQIEDAKASMQD